MTISYPRLLPSTRIASVSFEHEPQEAVSSEQGGKLFSTKLGPALWEARYATTPRNEEEYSLWRAWLDSLDGAGKEFFAYDVRRPMPWRYRRGFVDAGGAPLTRAVSGGAFDGTSTAWTPNEARDEIEIGGATGQQLPVGFNLIPGDYIELRKGTFRSLHRAIDDANTGGDGVGTWTIRPFIHPQVPVDCTVNLIKASCRMVVTKRQRDAEHIARNVSFEAVQNFDPSEA